jgi:hypothetical protein
MLELIQQTIQESLELTRFDNISHHRIIKNVLENFKRSGMIGDYSYDGFEIKIIKAKDNRIRKIKLDIL